MKGEGDSGVIARAATVLKVLEACPAGLSLAQLARHCSLPRSTVYRLVASLEAQQFVSQTATGVTLGPALARLAAAAHTDIVALARPAIEALARRTRETVDLAVHRGLHAILVEQSVSDRELRVVSPPGTAFPINATAPGKALLAALPDDRLYALLPEKLEQRTANTCLDRADLLIHLQEIRNKGVAIDREEHALGVCGVAVALTLPGNERYALSLAAPALRFDEHLPTLLPALLQTKAEIESLAGK
ncbi:IclR family transcriptional regulator [Erwinia sp. MMLR14_017]|uniref:IclR family transcriptional regulator n=1 Tax=Erwinia sp. MMLR14_017 TaxID=3093842 RepID=UPI0029903329|nr:IclR family transcriptional regulator [Erwinia sp. MMLR14_017]MDW8844442.1 IclR family transcriptional regulator [Erwinia sp. MMLR14_017]